MGTIGTFGNSIPNLFLINPNGIIFGENASLDIGNSGVEVGGTGGSFVATTANAVLLRETGGIFSASNPGASNLLNIAPSALFFNGNSTAQIVNRSSATTSVLGFETDGLRVPDERSLILVGGNVTLDNGKLYAAGGNVELAGVTKGTVGLNIDSNDLSLSLPTGLQRADVLLTNGSWLWVLGSGSGNIAINAQNLDILEFSVLVGGVFSGQGSIDTQAGDVTLNATGNITIAGKDNSSFFSTIFNNLFPESTGQGGDINISGNLVSLNGADIKTISSGQGNAGDISIQASSLFLNNTSLNAGTNGEGNAGNIIIQVDNSSSIASSFLRSDVNPTAVGKGGNIEIQTGSLFLTNDSFLATITSGQGDAGSVFIQADDLTLDDSTIVSDNFGDRGSTITGNGEKIALGNGGDIQIVTGSLTLNNGSALSTSTSGLGDAGNVVIKATGSVSLAESSNIFSIVAGNNSLGVEGDNGEILDIIRAAAVGNGGDIYIEARSLSISGNSTLSTSTNGIGNAGDVSILTSGAVTFTDNSAILSGVFSNAFVGQDEVDFVGRGGDLNIVADSLNLNDSVLATATAGKGNAGAIAVRANNIFLTNGSLITSEVQRGAIGNAGDINFINAGQFNLSDGAGVSLDSQGQGDAGNLKIQTNSLSLDGDTFISATTASGEGGNIDIKVETLVLLRRNSNITTAAGGTGNGGNINIDSTFIVAPASEDSNIIADAIAGNGGNIDITTQGIFGIASRPAQTNFSDITASSQLGIDGNVAITNPDIDPSQGLVALPVEVVDATNQIASSCTNERQATNRFTVTGRGGLPPNPYNPLTNDSVLTDWATVELIDNNAPPITKADRQPSKLIVEAQGWIVDPQGRVVLTARSPQVTPSSSPSTTTCNGS